MAVRWWFVTQSVAESRPAGLGRYRFGETLSKCFFGPRFRVIYEGSAGHSDAPPGSAGGPSRSSLRPRGDMPLALRLIEVDAPSLLEHLARAVQTIRDVDHRAVLRPIQIVRASTRLGIVTPNVEGLTLSKLLQDAATRQESIPPAVALRILSDLLNGLQALSDQGPVSRRREWCYGGLTPDSIHVGSDGQTRFLDPGVAAAAARQPCWAHEASALAYMAPEQTGADPSFDASSDTFSIGVVLWEMLACQPLFGTSTAAQTLERLHRAPIPRVQRQPYVRGEPIAARLAQVVAQALRREVKQRFATYDELANALDGAGEVASRNEVGELVRRALPEAGHESFRPREHAVTLQSTPAQAGEETRAVLAEPLPPSAATSLVRVSPPTLTVLSSPFRTSFWPAHANWKPDEPNPTAFPVGDLELAIDEQRPHAWSYAIMVAAAIALGLFTWKMQVTAPDELRSNSRRTAASAPQRADPNAAGARDREEHAASDSERAEPGARPNGSGAGPAAPSAEARGAVDDAPAGATDGSAEPGSLDPSATGSARPAAGGGQGAAASRSPRDRSASALPGSATAPGSPPPTAAESAGPTAPESSRPTAVESPLPAATGNAPAAAGTARPAAAANAASAAAGKAPPAAAARPAPDARRGARTAKPHRAPASARAKAASAPPSPAPFIPEDI
jgi:serine/threonine protein kinase